MRKLKFEVNQLVVVSHALDATIYRVRDLRYLEHEHIVGVIDAGLNIQNQSVQYQDKSIFKCPSIGQINRHTAQTA